MFSAYTLDPEHGWIATHRLPFNTALAYCKDYRSRYGGSLVAVVPDQADPKPYLELVAGRGKNMASSEITTTLRRNHE